MSFAWEPLAVRARGLATHLLDGATLERLSRAEHRAELRGVLEGSPWHDLVSDFGAEPFTHQEHNLVRSVANRFALLHRWAHPSEDTLAAVFLPLDARAIRGIARGIAGGMPPEDRIRDAIPTPTLDLGALRLLSGIDSVATLAATLSAWGHPLAVGLTEVETGVIGRPDLFAVEASLGRALSRAVVESARRLDGPLRRWAAEEIDVWNLVAALVLSYARREVGAHQLFVEGGTVLGMEDFEAASTADGGREAIRILEKVGRGTVLGTALARVREGPRGSGALSTVLENAVLDARIDRLTAEIRRHPLSSAPVLSYVLRNLRELRALRRALWRTALPSRRAS